MKLKPFQDADVLLSGDLSGVNVVKYIANLIKWRYHMNRGWTWVQRHLPIFGRNGSVLIRELDRTLVAQDVPACGEDLKRYSLEWITG